MTTYPGGEVTVATELGGRLARLTVVENDVVRAGDLLAELDVAVERAALTEAQANARGAAADARYFRNEVAREEHLAASGAGTPQSLDRARHELESALARAASTEATVERLRSTVAKSRILAPLGGVVIARHAEPGETLPPGGRVVGIADLRRLRVEAEIDEFDVGRVDVGAPAVVSAEGYDGVRWRGRIEEIPGVVTARRLKPQDPGRPSDTRVLLVKIALGEPTPLKLGQRVEIEIAPRSSR
jgi:RND family efflux transporter MFP subunit